MHTTAGSNTKADIREQKEIDAIVDALEAEGYTPLVRTLARAASDAASLTSSKSVPLSAVAVSARAYYSGEEETPIGDILFRDGQAFVLQPMNHQLEAWEVRHCGTESTLEEFTRRVETAAVAHLDGRRLRGMQFTWEPIHIGVARASAPWGRRPLELPTTEPVHYDDEEARRAGVLRSRDHREFILRLAQMRGRVRASDTTDADGSEADTELANAGLIRSEFLVVCRGDSRTIMTVPDQAELDAAPASQFKCPVCGRCLRDELIQEIFAVTDAGQELLAGSHWMTVWVTTLLEEAGVPREAIAWNVATGDDEIDIVVSLPGLTIFFELKDREFGLGDAYPFASRTARYGATMGVVVTTETVAEEAKTFLTDRAGMDAVPIMMLEGERGIENGLRTLVTRWSTRGVQRTLSEVMERMGSGTSLILETWMQQGERTGSRRRAATTRARTAETLEAVSASRPAAAGQTTNGASQTGDT